MKMNTLDFLDIQQSSTEPCHYVNIASEVINPNQIFGPEGPVEGYLISLGEGHCISGGGGGHPI